MMPAFHTLIEDLRQAVKAVNRRRLAASVVMAAMALCVGASSAVFTVARSVLMRPLPYHEPDRLVVLRHVDRNGPPDLKTSYAPVTEGAIVEWGARGGSFSALAAVQLSWTTNKPIELTGDGAPERLRVARVTPNVFEVLGVKAALGRTFDREDSPAGTANVTVLSDAYWRRRFGADPRVIGRVIHFNREPFVVIGVLPEAVKYTYPEATEAWIVFSQPLATTAVMCCEAIARLKPDVQVPEAQARMDLLTSALYQESRDGQWLVPVRVELLRDHVLGRGHMAVLLLAGAVLFVVLIACANIAHLLLARTLERGRELATRAALGARPSRLVWQLVTEGMLIGLAGGAAGVAAAAASVPLLKRLVPPDVPRADEIALDAAVVAFAFVLTLGTSLIASIVPAWHGAHARLLDAFRENGGGTAGGRRSARWRRNLVAAQVALVLAMLTAASLLLYSFWRLNQVSLGFDPQHVLTARMQISTAPPSSDVPAAYPQYRRQVLGPWLERFKTDLLAQIDALPDVADASVTSAIPLRGPDKAWVVRREHARRGVGGGDGRIINARVVEPAYFNVMRIRLRQGRAFTTADAAGTSRVCILSESLAKLLFGGENPIGHRVTGADTCEVVGVVDDVRSVRIADTANPAIYVPLAQEPEILMAVVIRAERHSSALPAAVRRVIHSLQPNQAIDSIDWLDAVAWESVAERRFYGVVTVALGVLALLLAVMGLFGLVAASVAERRREIGIRMAIGAQRSEIARQVIGDGLRPVVVGGLFGAVLAFFTSRLLQHMLFDTPPWDPMAFASAVTLLVATAVLGCVVPAWRAATVDPASVLRGD